MDKYLIEEKHTLELLGKKIQQLRKMKGMTQSEIAKMCGADKTNISRIESGNVNPAIITIKKIAEALGVSIRDVFPEEMV